MLVSFVDILCITITSSLVGLGYVGYVSWNKIRKYLNNLKNASYFFISINSDCDEYIEILNKNATNILNKLNEIFILNDNCDFKMLEHSVTTYTTIKRCVIFNDSDKMLFKIIGCIGYDMMEDLKNITGNICSNINTTMQYKKIPIRIGCYAVNNQWIFKFYNMSTVQANNNMSIYQFVDNDKDGSGESFALIEHSEFHQWLEYYYPLYKNNNLLSIIDTDMCDGLQRTYSKILIDGKKDVDILKNRLTSWIFAKWYESDDTNVSNAYWYESNDTNVSNAYCFEM